MTSKPKTDNFLILKEKPMLKQRNRTPVEQLLDRIAAEPDPAVRAALLLTIAANTTAKKGES